MDHTIYSHVWFDQKVRDEEKANWISNDREEQKGPSHFGKIVISMIAGLILSLF